MKASLKVKLGDKVLELSGEGAETVIIQALAFWSQLPNSCGKCKSLNIGLSHKAPQENDYYGLKCNDCGAEFNFHQKKKGGFYITKDDKWEIWQGKTENKTQQNGENLPPTDCPF